VRAAVLREIGGQLAIEDVSEPQQPAVVVRAAGVSFADTLIRRGAYPQMPEFPFVPGSEIAGELDGRRVMGFVRGAGGGYAEKAAVDPRWILDLPDGASFAEGAGFLLGFLTAWIPLTRQLPSVEGRTVLVHAAAGGVGSAAVQVARHLGARVVGTASTEEKRAFVRELGAESVYGYDEFADAVRPDIVVDPVGGSVFVRSLSALEPLGAIIAIGYAAGPWQDVSPQLIVGRNISVVGFYLGRLMRLRPEVVRRAAEELVELWRAGALKPIVGGEYSLDDATDALDALESRRTVGKIVLVL